MRAAQRADLIAAYFSAVAGSKWKILGRLPQPEKRLVKRVEITSGTRRGARAPARGVSRGDSRAASPSCVCTIIRAAIPRRARRTCRSRGTRERRKAVDIALLDHVILAAGAIARAGLYSFREQGLL